MDSTDSTILSSNDQYLLLQESTYPPSIDPTSVTCRACQKLFIPNPALVKQGYGQLCSRACVHSTLRTNEEKPCKYCGTLFYSRKSHHTLYCSRECYRADPKPKKPRGDKNASTKRHRAERKRLGLCLLCGLQKESSRWVTCQDCRERKRVHGATRRTKMTEEERELLNLQKRLLRKQRHPKYRDWWLQRKYNITSQDYERLLKEQKWLCAICHQPNRGRWKVLSVDHDHRTGKVRGLLCTHCNRQLGFLRDDPVRMHNLIRYLNKALKSQEEVAFQAQSDDYQLCLLIG